MSRYTVKVGNVILASGLKAEESEAEFFIKVVNDGEFDIKTSESVEYYDVKYDHDEVAEYLESEDFTLEVVKEEEY